MFTLDEVVPWGRSYDEYCRMFALGTRDLSGRILGCGDGPASFNAEATARGVRVVSCDPIYAFTADEIRRRVDETAPAILEQTREHLHEFVWTTIATPEELLRVRLEAMGQFLTDYAAREMRHRYVAAALPFLPFPDISFEIALCSHFLFLYSDRLDADFHVASLHELSRVAADVRVFPLLNLAGRRSEHVGRTIQALKESGLDAQIETVPYEFQRGGNEMLRVRRP
jgi:hypothetical protein